MARLKPRRRKKNGRWEVYGFCGVFYDPDQKPREQSVTLRTKDRRIAQRRLVELERLYSLGEWNPWSDRAPENGLSFKEAIDRYVRSRDDRRPKTLRADRSTLMLFREGLPKGALIEHVEPHHVERFLRDLRNAGRSSATLHTYMTRIRGFSSWCVQQGYLKSDFTRGIRRPKLAKKEKVVLTRDQYDQLIRTIENEMIIQTDRLHDGEIEWMLDLLPIAISTGMRLSEICAMRWSWISLARKTITVSRADGFAPKSGHERTIPVRGKALEVLRRLGSKRTTEDDSAFVLRGVTDREGKAGLDPTYVSKRFKHFVRKAALPERISFHSLRHSFCTWLIQDRVPVPVVQRLAGHADIKTTMGYVHVAGSDLASAIEMTFS